MASDWKLTRAGVPAAQRLRPPAAAVPETRPGLVP